MNHLLTISIKICVIFTILNLVKYLGDKFFKNKYILSYSIVNIKDLFTSPLPF